MNKNPYRSTKQTRQEAARISAYIDGGGVLPKGTTQRLVLPPREIRRIRTEVLKLNQQEFANLVKKQLITVQSWEQGLRVPDTTAMAVIMLLAKHIPLRAWLAGLNMAAGEAPTKLAA